MLAAVYFLRSRQKRREVSSLLLWPKEALPKSGGRKASPFRSSWLLILELLILTLLALAAAGPIIGAAASRRQVCIVLDDSVSMRAHDGEGHSARTRARQAVLAEMGKIGRFEAHVVVAGPRPVLAGTANSLQALGQLLGETEGSGAHWSCLAESSDIQAALNLVAQTAPPGAVTLVVSGRAVPANLPAGVRCMAVGQALPNVGLTAAARGGASALADAGGRVLLEISNFASVSGKSEVVLEVQDGRGGWLKVASAQAQVPAGGRTTLAIQTAVTQTLRARLSSPDALDEDNAVLLLPEAPRTLPVKVEVAHPALRAALLRALQASGTKQVASGAHLLITDSPEPMLQGDGKHPASVEAPPPDVWEWRIADGGKTESAQAFSGPYILNHTHPLTRGLSLEGVVWGMPSSGLSARADDEEIIGLGDRPLLVDRLFPAGQHRLRSAFAPDISTLAQTPAFPVLVSNLVDWRLDHEPGLRRANWRQGELARIAVPVSLGLPGAKPDEGWLCTLPDGRKTFWHGGPVIEVPTPCAGLYGFSRKDGPAFEFFVNLCNANASDLREAATAQAGVWPDAVALEGRFRAAFVLILLALALLAWHGHLARKGVQG